MAIAHDFGMTRVLKGVGVSALAASLLLAGGAAFAGDRGGGGRASAHRPATASRPAERPRRPASASTVVERTDTGMTRTTTVTNGQGETRTSTTTVTRDPDAGSRSVEVERTGFDGQTSSVSREMQRTEDGLEHSIEVTRPDGETMTRETSVSRDEDGNRVIEHTRTGFDGETRTVTAGPEKQTEEPETDDEQ
jgi:hypothetical protein